MDVPVEPISAPFVLPRGKPEREIGINGGCGDASPPRRAIYRSHSPSMDEGWTRWVLDNEDSRSFRCLFYRSVEDAEIRRGNLRDKFDSIVIPDQNPVTILNGYRPGIMPTELTGGLGPAGIKALREFVEQGGTLVCLNRASNFAIEQFKLPVRNVVSGVSEKEFYVPGSILRIQLDTSSPLAKGMKRDSIAWVEDSPVFELSTTDISSTAAYSTPVVKIVARYPDDKNPLLSGWLLGADRLKGKAALVEVEVGKGRIILFGFRPQYRGQSMATYPLFFNAISGR
jgi:hypothetical protein